MMSGMLARVLLLLLLLLLVATATATATRTADKQAVEEFSPELAKTMMEYAGAAYCHESYLTPKWDCVFCKDAPNTNATTFYAKSTDMFGFVGYVAAAPPATATTNNNNNNNNNDNSNGWIVLSFRGTEPLSIKDWLDDLNFAQQKEYANQNCSGCAVHRGFHDAWSSVKAQVYGLLQPLLTAYPNAMLHVTGHSLGASVALLAAVELQLELKIAAHRVYTFGLPRVGNKQFAAFANSLLRVAGTTVYRVTHYADPVVRLPPTLFGYKHTAREVWYNEANTNYRVCDGSGEDRHCSDSVLLPVLLTDHWNYSTFGLFV
jgi:hypothetical protein